MVDIISAKDAQNKISEIDYRTRLHEWVCLPDLQVNTHVRMVTDQISDVSPQTTRSCLTFESIPSFVLCWRK